MKKLFRILAVMMVGMVILATLILTGCSSQQDVIPFASVYVAGPSVNPTPSSDGVPPEGIKVHGNWTIDLTNSDGTAAGHYEFENALTNHGKDILVQLLGRSCSVGAWAIGLIPSGFKSWDTSTSPWGTPGIFGGTPTAQPGYIGETGAYLTNSQDFQMTITSDFTIQLGGSIEVPDDVTISDVETILYKLSSTVPPQNGWGSTDINSQVFTYKTLDEPVSLQKGQTVQVSVVISFS